MDPRRLPFCCPLLHPILEKEDDIRGCCCYCFCTCVPPDMSLFDDSKLEVFTPFFCQIDILWLWWGQSKKTEKVKVSLVSIHFWKFKKPSLVFVITLIIPRGELFQKGAFILFPYFISNITVWLLHSTKKRRQQQKFPITTKNKILLVSFNEKKLQFSFAAKGLLQQGVVRRPTIVVVQKEGPNWNWYSNRRRNGRKNETQHQEQ